MRKLLLAAFTLLLFTFMAQAQAPQAFKYQAVVRDAAGQVLPDQEVGLQIELFGQDTIYRETHTATTNAFGLVNLEIGRGTALFGDFATIDWNQQIIIVISLDVTGGTDYVPMGSSELLSVPYALYAANGGGSDDDADPTNEIQTLTQTGAEVTLSNGGGMITVNDADADPANELELPQDAEKGDLAYHDGTAWQRLPAGAPGTVLTMGADGLPFWKTQGQLDSLLQVTMTNGDVIYVSPVDNNAPGGVEWGGYGTDITAVTNVTNSAAANMDFNGQANTAAIVAQLGDNGGTAYAAKVCADLVAYGFDDWYLPAAGELNEMFLKLGPGGSGQITSDIYWSSSESSDNGAWLQGFSGGGQAQEVKSSAFIRCRCVRN